MARLNVGLTRARQALIIIGNLHTLGVGTLSASYILDYLSKPNNFWSLNKFKKKCFYLFKI